MERMLASERVESKFEVEVLPLHGNLSPAAQDAAIKPHPEKLRRVILSTPIAESSVTIEGVRVVVDSGLRRSPVYDTRTGVNRLEVGGSLVVGVFCTAKTEPADVLDGHIVVPDQQQLCSWRSEPNPAAILLHTKVLLLYTKVQTHQYITQCHVLIMQDARQFLNHCRIAGPWQSRLWL